MGAGTAYAGLRQARHLVELRRWTDALHALGPALADPGLEPDAQCLRAQCLLALDRSREAQRAAERAALLTPDAEWPHRLRAIALLQRRRTRAAIAAAREAVRLAPWSAATLDTLAMALSRTYLRRREAGRVAAELVRTHPTSADAHGTAAAVAANRGRWKEAEEHGRRALALDPTSAEHARVLGQVLRHRGRQGRREASDVLLAAARADPTHRDNRRLLGRLGAPVLGSLFVVKYVLGRIAVDVVEYAGPLTRAVLLLGGILLLGSLMIAFRIRGARHLPADVRRALLHTEHRNHALGWLLAFSATAFALGVIQEVGVLGRGGVVAPLVAVQLALAVLAAAAVWRLWSGPRPDVLARLRRPLGRRRAA